MLQGAIAIGAVAELSGWLALLQPVQNPLEGCGGVGCTGAHALTAGGEDAEAIGVEAFQQHGDKEGIGFAGEPEFRIAGIEPLEVTSKFGVESLEIGLKCRSVLHAAENGFQACHRFDRCETIIHRMSMRAVARTTERCGSWRVWPRLAVLDVFC